MDLDRDWADSGVPCSLGTWRGNLARGPGRFNDIEMVDEVAAPDDGRPPLRDHRYGRDVQRTTSFIVHRDDSAVPATVVRLA
jgi:hypothetical protein